jgi:two-component system cell cycle sensor histidine kinase/response regulator CckA
MAGTAARKATILIADDDLAILRVTAAILGRLDYDVLTAPSGESALSFFAASPQTIHLVISDVVMPGIKGPQLFDSIKSISPSIGILLMSGSWKLNVHSSVPMIEKPFQIPTLVRMVEGVLSGCDFAKIELEQSIAKSQRPAFPLCNTPP